jgi:hypothetical protein
MSDTAEKKTVVTKKTVKKKQAEATVMLQGKEVTPSAISDASRKTICVEIQKWKSTGNLDVQRYAKIMRACGYEPDKRARSVAIKFSTELNALGDILGCKLFDGKTSCCGQ